MQNRFDKTKISICGFGRLLKSKSKAVEKGIPYQTLLSSLIHHTPGKLNTKCCKGLLPNAILTQLKFGDCPHLPLNKVKHQNL